MKMQAGNQTMVQGRPLAVILRFVGPLLVGNLCSQLYSVVDTAIVGRFLGAEALAAVGATGSVCGLLFMVLSGLCTGAGVIVAQAWGARNYTGLRTLLGTFLALIVGFSAVVAVLGVALAGPVLGLLQVPAALLPLAAAYLRITTGWIVGNALYNAAAAVLRSIGDSRTPLLAVAASSVANVALDLWCIVGLGLGVQGAALATVVSQSLSAGICLARLWWRRTPFDFSTVRPCFARGDARLLFRYGVPNALQFGMLSLSGMAVQGLVNSFGSATMAAYTAVQRIDALTIQIVVSTATALGVFTGQNIGAGAVERVRLALRQTLCALCAACLALAAAVFAARYALLALFLDPAQNPESTRIGAQYLTIIGVAYLVAAVMNCCLNVLRAAGDMSISALAGGCELCARVAFAYTLAPLLGPLGIWLATPLSWACGSILPVARYCAGHWANRAAYYAKNQP